MSRIGAAFDRLPGIVVGGLAALGIYTLLQWTPLGNYSGYVFTFLLGFAIAFAVMSRKMLGEMNDHQDTIRRLMFQTATLAGLMETAQKRGYEAEAADRATAYQSKLRQFLQDIDDGMSHEEARIVHSDLFENADEMRTDDEDGATDGDDEEDDGGLSGMQLGFE